MGHAKWTTENMPDLSGKVMIVTGSNRGLGYESVRAFAEYRRCKKTLGGIGKINRHYL
jgi:hypothetical protein